MIVIGVMYTKSIIVVTIGSTLIVISAHIDSGDLTGTYVVDLNVIELVNR